MNTTNINLMNELITIYKRDKIVKLETSDVELWNEIKHIMENKNFITFIENFNTNVYNIETIETIDNNIAKTIITVYSKHGRDNYMFARMVALYLYH